MARGAIWIDAAAPWLEPWPPDPLHFVNFGFRIAFPHTLDTMTLLRLSKLRFAEFLFALDWISSLG